MTDGNGAEPIWLPADLGQAPDGTLGEWNAALRAGTAWLDWSSVTVAPPAALDRLLAGLSLDRDFDALGGEEIPEALQELVVAALDRVSEDGRTAPARSRPLPGVVPAAFVEPAATATPVELADDESDDDPAVAGKDGETVLQPITPRKLRDEFQRLILADLLGPAGGAEEEVESPITDRYILGKLAPQGTLIDMGRRGGAERAGEEGEESPAEAALGDAEMATFGAAADEAEETRADPEAAGPRIVYPSSMGLSFTVSGDVPEIEVFANWGRYERQVSEFQVGSSGEPVRVWKRVPVAGAVRLAMAAGDVEPSLVVNPEYPNITVRGRIRRRGDDWAVTLFLENGQPPAKTSKGAAWLFQAEVGARSIDGMPAIVRRPIRGVSGNRAEDQLMEMAYRNEREFAVGHGVSVDWKISAEDPTCAVEVRTKSDPAAEVPRIEAPDPASLPGMEGAVLGMAELGAMDGPAAAEALAPLANAYERWIDLLEARRRTEPDLADFQEPARDAIEQCRLALGRIREGIDLLRADDRAAAAFAFMNQAMALQRVRGIYAGRRRTDPEVSLEQIDVSSNRTWRPFQLAFVLLGLSALADPLHPDRSADPEDELARADLLWFPTGGGKTEAYLGLAAFAMAIRRLQGSIGGRTAGGGVCVLMRYTLRLLTLQQFQRASALVCAMEVLRLQARARGDARWGDERFRIGLWVGSKMTPNSTDTSAEAVRKLKAGEGLSTGSPHQLTHCPWCGTAIDPRKDIVVETYERGRGLTIISCGDSYGECPFTPRGSDGEGLPVLVVDEEIYRRLPALVIATVDKFAQMPWKGMVGALFGRVDGVCERHGYRSPDTALAEADFHQKRGSLDTARIRAIAPLRPPDLIIQDELHLISGPLGSMVGLYETAIDELCTFEVDGRPVRPKVVASTATIRRVTPQMHALFARRAEIFPPQGLDAGSSFFAERVPLADAPGRRYLGVMARGERFKAVLIRTYVAALAAAKTLYERHGKVADPYMSLLGYFGSMRELGGTRRLVDDDIQARLRAVDDRGLAKRSNLVVKELTSRISSTEIPAVLGQLGVGFDPAIRNAGRRGGPPAPIDVLLATNMVSVGVDVPRLGLMVVDGQPKTTAEYIQATSRVGREFDRPGLVITLYNWARPRDLSHFEQFRHYHATYYQQVEALSVTPFSPGAVERGLSGVLAGLVRLGDDAFASNLGAGAVTRDHQVMVEAMARIARRAAGVVDNRTGQSVAGQLEARRDNWMARIAGSSSHLLGYQGEADATGLLTPPGIGAWEPFTCLTSLREVEPTVGLVLIDPGATDQHATPRGTDE